ncbi:MAG: hypothetical protein QE271_10015 [Bacteriovoracaceae bacterium]|nr:hypothetical protein [Bacteriovoracaceae bacterium]
MGYFLILGGLALKVSAAAASSESELGLGGKIAPVREYKIPVNKILKYMLFSHSDYYFMFPPFDRVYKYETSEYGTSISVKANIANFVSIERSYEFKYEKEKTVIFYVAPSYIVEENGKEVDCEALNPIGNPNVILELKDILNKEVFHRYVDTKYQNDPVRKSACKKIPITFNCVMAQKGELDRSWDVNLGNGQDIGILRGLIPITIDSNSYYKRESGIEVDSISGYYPVPYSYTYDENGAEQLISVRNEKDIETFCEKFVFPQKEKRIYQQLNSTMRTYFFKSNSVKECEEDFECPDFKDERSWFERNTVGGIGTVYKKCLPIKYTSSAYTGEEQKMVCQFRSSQGSKCNNFPNDHYPPCQEGFTCVGAKLVTTEMVDPWTGSSSQSQSESPGVCY